MNNRNTNGGYIALLLLLIGVALIIFFVVRTDLFSGKPGDKNMIEQGTDAVKQAENAKALLEQQNKQSVGE